MPDTENATGNRIGIAASVLAELAFRAEGSPQRDRNILRLRQALEVWKLWLVDTAAAFEYSRIAFAWKMIGRPIGQNDLIIAAIALTLGNTAVVRKRKCSSSDLLLGLEPPEVQPPQPEGTVKDRQLLEHNRSGD